MFFLNLEILVPKMAYVHKSIFKYKVTNLMQKDSKSAIYFLSLDMYFNGKKLKKLGTI